MSQIPNTTQMSPAIEPGPNPLVLFLVAAPFQIVQGLQYLWNRSRLPFQERRLARVCRALGREMHHAGVGDQLLREQIDQIKESSGRQVRGRTGQAEESLGRSALGVDVPIIVVETRHREALRSNLTVRQTRDRIKQMAARLRPGSTLGWLQHIVSYVLLLLLFVTVLSLTVPGWNSTPSTSPQSLGKPELTAHIGSATIQVISAGIRFDIVPASLQGIIRSSQPIFAITLRIRNDGEPMTYRTWRGQTSAKKRDFATVIDSRGDVILRIVSPEDDLPPVGGVTEASISRGDTVTDILMFAPPSDRVTHVDLFLPGENLGLEDSATIRIPSRVFEQTKVEPDGTG